ncbi:winged helix-turn-helix transcriptional regulator [Lacrimispora saccharolytica]|uniref:Transcriptional regulator, HxlR family n=1 Tax=Lacrimispora saccharolytica (strain ATCC 35040 / DSM 2544 / NRCC 2533 / WM1) TaxID=610130 RepID=D9R539_LACSW|nr:helix-turn-helix domain-containing protein [Lacrimispora saccharolytica]ADL05146.1 transcriptional regulator, HxlR family [[Clostridium] saccharolyticum WM1]QRV20669.1 helix-turn-helix transcriptional regulator [Lacrimispora saccharolytica]
MNRDCTNYHCPVDATLDMIGGKYKALILWHLISNTLRFGELRKLIPQATPKMLTQQLRELEEDHLIIRTVYPVVPPKVEYTLSDLGNSIRPILEAMYNWGADYLHQNGITVSCSMKFPTSNFNKKSSS